MATNAWAAGASGILIVQHGPMAAARTKAAAAEAALAEISNKAKALKTRLANSVMRTASPAQVQDIAEELSQLLSDAEQNQMLTESNVAVVKATLEMLLGTGESMASSIS